MAGDPVKLSADGKDVLDINMAIVGGEGAFIAYHHDTGINLANQASERNDRGDGVRPFRFNVVASALHEDGSTSKAAGQKRGIQRPYESYTDLIAGEAKLPADQRAAAVSIRLPNKFQHDAVMAFLKAGYHVVVDKPNAIRPSQASEQADLASSKGLISAVTYTYSGAAMMREMRQRVMDGGLENITSIHGTYPQGWIIGLDKDLNFRMQYDVAGGFGVSADLGVTHTLTDMEFATGLKIEEITANLFNIPNHPDPKKASEVDNYGQALLLMGDGNGFQRPATAWWAQVSKAYGNDHSVAVDMLNASYKWTNSVIPGPGSEALMKLDDAGYLAIPRDPNTPGRLTSKAALRACKGPEAHSEGIDHWFKAIYYDAGAQMAGAIYGVGVPEAAKGILTLDNGARSLWFLYKLAESHAKGGVPVNAKFDKSAIPKLEAFVQKEYLDKIAPQRQ